LYAEVEETCIGQNFRVEAKISPKNIPRNKKTASETAVCRASRRQCFRPDGHKEIEYGYICLKKNNS